MFDMSWGEIMVIGGVALIVIGPKDLPRALRTVGQMTTKVRRMAGEFQSQFSEAMREAELEDVRKEVEGLKRDVSAVTSGLFNPLQTIRDELKGSIEAGGMPVTSGSAADPAYVHGDWTAGQSELTVTSLDEAGPVPEVEAPADPAPDSAAAPVAPLASEPVVVSADALPEVLPLVPLPTDEPVLPAPDPVRHVTGPGLEPAGEADLPGGVRA